jgi:hypothetical protein
MPKFISVTCFNNKLQIGNAFLKHYVGCVICARSTAYGRNVKVKITVHSFLMIHRGHKPDGILHGVKAVRQFFVCCKCYETSSEVGLSKGARKVSHL